jgi:glutamine synthetase
MMMAGIDGIKNATVPVGPMDEDLFELSIDEINERNIPQMPHTLREALEGLIADNDFLKPVFSDEFLNAYQNYRFERDVWPDEGRPTAYEFKTTYQC